MEQQAGVDQLIAQEGAIGAGNGEDARVGEGIGAYERSAGPLEQGRRQVQGKAPRGGGEGPGVEEDQAIAGAGERAGEIGVIVSRHEHERCIGGHVEGAVCVVAIVAREGQGSGVNGEGGAQTGEDDDGIDSGGIPARGLGQGPAGERHGLRGTTAADSDGAVTVKIEIGHREG